MARKHLEHEVKFESQDGAGLPDLTDAVTGVTERVDRTQLKAVYYDTADRHLQRRSITLRRRVGGDDAGWHLKLPADHSRLELQVPSRSATVPRELSELLKGVRFAQPLVPTATIETRRVSHGLQDQAGGLIAEVDEDSVQATVAGDGARQESWREIEIELGPAGGEETLAALAAALKEQGARVATYPSKYARVVGDPPEHDRPRRLAGLVDDYLQQQYDAIAENDLLLRRGENRVHKMRVAIRRTRSTLRVFSDLFDEDEAAALDAELRWFADVLGPARDLDIVRARLAVELAATAPEFVMGPVAADIASTLAADRAAAARALDAAMGGRRYRAFLLRLDRWRTDPPWTDAADQKASAGQAYVDKAGRKARRRLRQGIASGADADFHRARKAAKRHRYAAELLEPHAGQPAAKVVARAERLQDLLGELQDTVATRAVVLDLGRRVGADSGRNGFSYGFLYAAEERAAVDLKRSISERYG